MSAATSTSAMNCDCLSCSGNPGQQQTREFRNPQASFWRHRFRLPGTQWTLTGHSRALERTGFLLVEPKIFLDAGVGPRDPDGNCNAILITHTHIDHINALPLLARIKSSDGGPAIVVPRGHVNNVREFTRLSWGIKGVDGTERAGERVDTEMKPIPPPGQIVSCDDVGNRETHRTSSRGGRIWVPASPGLRIQLPGSQKVVCDCLRCFHTVTDAGFVLSETKQVTLGVDDAAQAEYEALLERCKVDKKAGREIGAMNKAGKLRRKTMLRPKVAFLCDTTPQVFGSQCTACKAGDPSQCEFSSHHGAVCEPDAEARATQRELLFACQSIIVECSFIGAAGMSDREADKEACNRGHSSWTQLRPHVESNPG